MTLLRSVLLLAIFGLLLALPAFLAALLAQVLIHAYPIPDLLLLGWIVGAAVAGRVPIGPNRAQVLDRKFDLERYFVDVLENATRSVQGLYLSTLVLIGMFFATMYLHLGSSSSIACRPHGKTVVLSAH